MAPNRVGELSVTAFENVPSVDKPLGDPRFGGTEELFPNEVIYTEVEHVHSLGVNEEVARFVIKCADDGKTVYDFRSFGAKPRTLDLTLGRNGACNPKTDEFTKAMIAKTKTTWANIGPS